MNPAPLELYVFGTDEAARLAGFRNDGRHRLYENLRGWWLALDPTDLRGQRFARVTITENLGRVVYNDRSSVGAHRATEVFVQLDHARRPGDIWIDLR